jgi:hypothetical protein
MNENNPSIETHLRPFFSRCFVTTFRRVSRVDLLALTRATISSVSDRRGEWEKTKKMKEEDEP